MDPSDSGNVDDFEYTGGDEDPAKIMHDYLEMHGAYEFVNTGGIEDARNRGKKLHFFKDPRFDKDPNVPYIIAIEVDDQMQTKGEPFVHHETEYQVVGSI